MNSHLGPAPLVGILAPSIKDDPTIQAAANAVDKALVPIVQGIPRMLLWARLWQDESRLSPALRRVVRHCGGLPPLSDAELELLAWQMHVDFWDPAWPRKMREDLVKYATAWHRIKGTPASLKAALALFGYGVSPSGTAASRAAERAESKPGTAFPGAAMPAIASARQDGGPSGIIIEESGPGPYWATYQLGLPQIADIPTVQHIVKICKEMAPVRCRLWRIYTDAFDRRPIIWSGGTRHDRWSDGWWTMHSGVSVPEAPGSEDDLIVSFGTLRSFQSQPYALHDLAASFGGTTHYGFLAPYVDRPIWSRSAWGDVFPRNHGFAMSSLFSILWADRATTGRRWRGYWDARRWLDYTGFDRKLPPWRMGQRALSRSQQAYSGGNTLSDINACYSRPTAMILDAPPVWGASKWSEDGSKAHLLVIDERYISASGISVRPVNPGIPQVVGASLLASTAPVPDPHRAQQARHDEISAHMRHREALPPRTAASLNFAAQSASVAPCAALPSAITHYDAPQWLGAWTKPGRTWTTPRKISTQ